MQGTVLVASQITRNLILTATLYIGTVISSFLHTKKLRYRDAGKTCLIPSETELDLNNLSDFKVHSPKGYGRMNSTETDCLQNDLEAISGPSTTLVAV